MSVRGTRTKSQGGYAYIMALVAAAVMAVLAAVTAEYASHVQRRAREEELLFRGQAYRQAIQSYALAGPVKAFPRRLEDLLQDPRFAAIKRHLRALYPDPFSADGTWRLVMGPGGGIQGVASQGQDKPIKQANFPLALKSFESSQHYSDWIFLYQ